MKIAGLEDLDHNDAMAELDGLPPSSKDRPPKDPPDDDGDEEEAEDEEADEDEADSGDDDESPEDKPEPKKGVEKRIAQLTGEIAKLRRQRERDRGDQEALRRLIADRDEQLRKSRREAEDPIEPDADADPEDHIEYMKKKAAREKEEHALELARVRSENLEAIQRALHDDWDDLRSKWETTIMSDPVKVAVLSKAPDHMAAFYQMASAAQREEDGETEADNGRERARKVVSSGATSRSAGDPEPKPNAISNEELSLIHI